MEMEGIQIAAFWKISLSLCVLNSSSRNGETEGQTASREKKIF